MRSDDVIADPPRAARLKVFQPVRIRMARDTMRGHLLNLSLTGAMIHCEPVLAIGTTMLVDLCGTFHSARVVRAEGKRHGIVFHVGLRNIHVDAVLGAAKSLTTPAAA